MNTTKNLIEEFKNILKYQGANSISCFNAICQHFDNSEKEIFRLNAVIEYSLDMRIDKDLASVETCEFIVNNLDSFKKGCRFMDVQLRLSQIKSYLKVFEIPMKIRSVKDAKEAIKLLKIENNKQDLEVQNLLKKLK